MLSSVSIFLTHELKLLTNYNEHYLENIKIVKIAVKISHICKKHVQAFATFKMCFVTKF